MKNNKNTRATRLLAVGLLMATLPLLFKEYIHISDFFRGLLAGGGIGLELTGGLALWQSKRAKATTR